MTLQLKPQPKQQIISLKQANSAGRVLVSGVIHDSIADGPGLRMVVFTQGCVHRCKECHNQHTWVCSGKKTLSTKQLINLLNKNPLTKGVTLSGGEPMLQAKALAPFAQYCAEKDINIAIYSGFLFEDIMLDPEKRELLRHASILIDGKFDINLKSLGLKFKGSSNQRTINVQKSLKKGEVVLEKSKEWN